ncbi:RTA1-domain-containing protein [Calocera viscosa TUFC12733]|uniref:RTA1-domain-containing protein n=1 Tax=Calocera viscosa (strain TUFC12733) TaxID=1330018 RepID=A0A167KV15_CALVF|nr:RTA1-domain-containing protein [Calocera viscosa TUFC12733]
MSSSTELNFSPYGYTPTLYICGIYVALFYLSTFLHCVQAARSRLWWLFPTIVAGGAGEVIGWAGRLWSNSDVDNLNPFMMQCVSLLLGPSREQAIIAISRLGTKYSRLSPRLYSIVFITADVVALVVQAIGGGMASVAVQSNPPGDPDQGAHIMVSGIFWQIAAMTVYIILALEFFIRVRLDKPVRRARLAEAPPAAEVAEEGKEPAKKGNQFRLHGSTFPPELAASAASEIQQHGFGFAHGSKLSLMIIALSASTLLIYMRSIYRTVELLDGWSGYIITTEVYFNVLDAMPITLAMYTMNILHPSWLLYGKGTGGYPQGRFEMMETDRQAQVKHEGSENPETLVG